MYGKLRGGRQVWLESSICRAALAGRKLMCKPARSSLWVHARLGSHDAANGRPIQALLNELKLAGTSVRGQAQAAAHLR